jgi:D-alanine-D-alanine ligase
MTHLRTSKHISGTPDPKDYRRELTELKNKGIEVFINLCDGTADDELSGIGLVQVLEELGVAFTGANSQFFDPTREEMKEAAKIVGVPVPGSIFLHTIHDLAKLDHQISFPMLVKPPHGYASIGITRESRVTDEKSLELQAACTLEKFGGALVEEFIDGREFTALVAENPDNPAKPVSFQPVEFIFPPDECFKHYDMKWKDYERMSVAPVQDPEIDRLLRDLTARQFLAMRGNGYARCDFRMNKKGDIFMLEINPNCGIFYPPHEPGSADFILMNDPAGHASFLDLIIRGALKRRRTL